MKNYPFKTIERNKKNSLHSICFSNNKIFIIICLCCTALLFSSCAKKNPYAKRLNKIYKEQMPMYEQISVVIQDTIFSYNLTDSVHMLQDSIDKLTIINNYYLENQKEYNTKQAELYVEKARTLWWLRSSYDVIIDSYETLIRDAQLIIDRNRAIIATDSILIHEMDSLIQATTRPDSITFVIVQHEYNCGGGSVLEQVFFNNNMDIYKTKYYEK